MGGSIPTTEITREQLAEAAKLDDNVHLPYASTAQGKVVAIEGAQFGFEPEEYAIALPKGSELVGKVNEALANLKADGTFDKLVAEYIGETE